LTWLTIWIYSTKCQVFELEKQLWDRREEDERRSENLAKIKHLCEVHMRQNEQFESQRNRAWEMYRDAGAKASAAQTMMLSEIDRLVRQVNKYRVEKGETELGVSPGLVQVVEQFKSEHGG
jgi:hypothetical protein